jgi:hypothetical protein
LNDSTNPQSTQKVGAILFGMALVVFALIVWRSYFLIDDAFISFRYAKNWAEGLGPVYNPGIDQPVEGYSNFSWVVMLTVGAMLGMSPVVLAPALSIIAAALTLFLVYRCLIRRFETDGLSAGLAALALAALPSFGVWATGGLETALFGLLLFAPWYLLSAPREEQGEVKVGVLAGLMGIALVLTRVEGFLWIGGLCLAICVASRGTIPWKRLGVFLVVVALGVIPHLLWRHSYYGDWVANTVHAKGGFSSATLARGARSLATFSLMFLWPVLALAGPLGARSSKQRALGLSALVMAGGAIAYNFAVGGDWMPMFRFMAPASAFLAVLFGLGLQKLPKTPRITLAAVSMAFAILPIFDISPIPLSLRKSLYFREFQIGYQSEWFRWQTTTFNTGRNTWRGKALKSVLKGGESWSGGAIGATGYYSNIEILDRNGLVNRAVALREVEAGQGTAGHEKRVARAWFRSERPTFYKIYVSTSPVQPGSKRFDDTVQVLVKLLFTDPAERELTQCSTVRVIPIKEIQGLAAGSCLVVVEHEDDPKKAITFWSKYLQRSPRK